MDPKLKELQHAKRRALLLLAAAGVFRRIPTGIPFITSHTDVIANSKDRIAGNLAVFVKERFLDPESLVTLIHDNNPSRYVARWLTAQVNTRRVAGYLATAIEGVLQLVEDARLVVALGAPALIGDADQLVDRRFLGKCGQNVLIGLGLVGRPLDEQPLLGTQARLAAGMANPHGREAATEGFVGPRAS